ncbi:Sperm motility kinase 2B [Sciurus carolinensis]|uniref:non-specific serine/threonine protein kinase n=1 Tax=Sciurus carolinensis TaxID=30640 RepID=A0AA41NGE6_SCICA|nr:Sperm motility kinase 2B [Sciurus carolinensis]
MAFTDHYELLRAIGHGGFGQVNLACHRLTGVKVAVKVLPKEGQNFPVLSEPDMMMTMNHPNVIQLFQVIETLKNIYIVMEHAGGGQLFHHVPAGGMQEEEARRLFKQLACAIGYCHEKGIMHQDLKPENIMVDAKGNIKLIDFGLSTKFMAERKLNRFWDTLAYLAPKIILQKEYKGSTVDVWNLGVILYFMLTGRHPFLQSTSRQLLKQIVPRRYHIPHHVPTQARRLIHKILNFNPKRRPTVDQILQHPWLRQSEYSPHHYREALPRHPDPEIMTLLFDMGCDPYKTWVSVATRKFDDAMATYLILQNQKSHGEGCMFQGKPVPPNVGLHPCPMDLSNVPVLPKRSASEPALCTFPFSCEHQLPEEVKEPGQKSIRRASLPAISLRFLPARTPTPRIVSQPDHVFHMLHPQKILCRRVAAAESSHSFQDTSRGQPHDNRKCWKGVTRRIAICFQQICCCMPCVSKKVAPVEEGGQKYTRFRDRAAPVEQS